MREGMGRERKAHEIAVERLSPEGREKRRACVASERVVEIAVGGTVVVALASLPGMERELGAGFVTSSGLVGGLEEVKGVSYDEEAARIEVDATVSVEALGAFRERVVLGSSCGGGTGERSPELSMDCLQRFDLFATVRREHLFESFSDFVKRSALYRNTRGVHSAGAYRARRRIAFAEDIGRHNAVDKVLGACFLAGEKTSDIVLFTTGRLTAEVVLKAARHAVPVLASRSVATDAAVELAKRSQMALAGECSSRRAVLYSAFWRIVDGQPAT